MRILEDIAASYLLRRSRVKRGTRNVSRAVAIVATLAGCLMIGALVWSGALVVGNPPAAHTCYAPCTVVFADNVAEDNYREDFTRTSDGAPALVVTTTTKGR